MVHKTATAFRRHQRRTSREIPTDGVAAREPDPLLGAPPEAVYSSTAIQSTPGIDAAPINNPLPAAFSSYPSPTPSLMAEAPLDFTPADAPPDLDPEICTLEETLRPGPDTQVNTAPRPAPLPSRILPSLLTIASIIPTWLIGLFSLCAGKRKSKADKTSPQTSAGRKPTHRRTDTRDSRFALSPEVRPQRENTQEHTGPRKDYPVFDGVRVPPAPLHEYTGNAVVVKDVFTPEVITRGGFDGRPPRVERPGGGGDDAHK